MMESRQLSHITTADKKKAEVSLLGQRFVVRSEHDEDYIRKLANFVDLEMHEIRTKMRNCSNSHLSLLVALNLADKLFAQEAEMRELKGQTEAVLATALKDLDRAIEQLQDERMLPPSA